jgi:hypothetical protein
MESITSFKNLLEDEQYNWALYFYHLESKENRSSLENALLKGYQAIKGDNVERCCCNEGDRDDGPIPNCGPECCTCEPCKECGSSIRICRDVWFSVYHGIICVNCYDWEIMSDSV